jgi:DNA-directed RNA polymerase subunit E'/Rpb7
MNKQKDNDKKVYGVYSQSVLSQKVFLLITEVGKNVKQNLEMVIGHKTSGKCIAEGFIRPGSVRVTSYSSGSIRGDRVEYQVVFECMICHPVDGMLMECKTKTITKAGIHAEVIDADGTVPVTVFIARDHHFTDKRFSKVVENQKIMANVIGVRFELNDPYICVIANLWTPKE